MKNQRHRAARYRIIRVCLRHGQRDSFLFYRLIQTDAPPKEAHICDGKIYSLSVAKTSIIKGILEKKNVFDVSREKSEAVSVFRLVSRGRVFPSEMEEIIGDIISII